MCDDGLIRSLRSGMLSKCVGWAIYPDVSINLGCNCVGHIEIAKLNQASLP